MDERRGLILEDLVSNGVVLVAELANKFSVTYETIRKDLDYLEKKGFLIKSYGGATLKQNATEYPFNIRQEENILDKKVIAKKALELIPEKSSIILGSGSTTLELAKLLSIKSGFKIFTTSLPVANILIKSSNKVFFFGGKLRDRSSSVCGGWTIAMINQISVDLSFLGTDGFKNLDGPTSPSFSDAQISQEILKHSNKKYILGDHSKFSGSSLHKVCNWSDVSALITNKELDSTLYAKIKSQTSIILS